MKLLAADYLGLKETMIDPVEFKPSSLISEDQRKKKFQELTFCPGTDLGMRTHTNYICRENP